MFGILGLVIVTGGGLAIYDKHYITGGLLIFFGLIGLVMDWFNGEYSFLHPNKKSKNGEDSTTSKEYDEKD